MKQSISLLPDLISKQLLPSLTFLVNPLMNTAFGHVISVRIVVYFIYVTPLIVRYTII